MIDVSVNVLYGLYAIMVCFAVYFIVKHKYLYDKKYERYDYYPLLMLNTVFTVIIGIGWIFILIISGVNWV